MDKNVRIAVIKTDGIGDAVLASPFLFELRKNFKDAHITGFLSPAGAEVLGGLGVFDEIIIHDAKWLKYKKVFFLLRWLSAFELLFRVNKARPDIVIGMRWQDRLTSLIVSLSRAKDKYGYDTAGMGYGINHKIPVPAEKTHVIDRNMAILKEMLPGEKFKIKSGVSVCSDAACCTAQSGDRAGSVFTGSCLSGGRQMFYGFLKGVKKKYIVIHPVSGCPAKDWPADKYLELAKRLAKKTAVYIIGTKNDAGISKITGNNIYNSAGELSIRGIASLIKGAAMVIGNDSAAVHMAAALNVKSLTLFSGSALHEEWGAYGKKSFLMAKEVPCRKCGLSVCDRQGHECMDFEAAGVEKAVYKILSGRQKSKLLK